MRFLGKSFYIIGCLVFASVFSAHSLAGQSINHAESGQNQRPQLTLSARNILSTPEPEVTPVPVDTFCDIPLSCDIYVYNAGLGESSPLENVYIELVDDTCGFDFWVTDSSGWSHVYYIHHQFNLDLLVHKPMFFDVLFTANSQSCPASIGLYPMYTQSPQPPHDGDVNQDGDLSAEDAQLAFMIALGLYSPSSEQWDAADCDGNYDVTAADAQLIFLAVMHQGNCVDPLIY